MKPGDLVRFVGSVTLAQLRHAPRTPDDLEGQWSDTVVKGSTVGFVVATSNLDDDRDVDAFVLFSGPHLGWIKARYLLIVSEVFAC